MGRSIKAIFALSLPKIMTLPGQPDLRQPQPTFRPSFPLPSVRGKLISLEGEAATRSNVYNAVSSRNRSTPCPRWVKRQQTLRRGGTVISTPDMANHPSLHPSTTPCKPCKIFYRISHMNSLFLRPWMSNLPWNACTKPPLGSKWGEIYCKILSP